MSKSCKKVAFLFLRRKIMDSEDKGNIGIDKLSIAIRTMGVDYRRD